MFVYLNRNPPDYRKSLHHLQLDNLAGIIFNVKQIIQSGLNLYTVNNF
jgi:hypothetical protein